MVLIVFFVLCFLLYALRFGLCVKFTYTLVLMMASAAFKNFAFDVFRFFYIFFVLWNSTARSASGKANKNLSNYLFFFFFQYSAALCHATCCCYCCCTTPRRCFFDVNCANSHSNLHYYTPLHYELSATRLLRGTNGIEGAPM